MAPSRTEELPLYIIVWTFGCEMVLEFINVTKPSTGLERKYAALKNP